MPDLQPANPVDVRAAEADSRPAAGARHRAPAAAHHGPSDATIVLADWVAYGRHAAPVVRTSLPAVPPRTLTPVPAAQPDADDQPAEPGTAARADEAPVPVDAPEPDAPEAPRPGGESARTGRVLGLITAFGRRSGRPTGESQGAGR